jgi:thioredoxin reductase
VKEEITGLMANGDMAFDISKLIANLTKDLTIFTNGASTLTPEQTAKLAQHNIPVVEKLIKKIEHDKGQISRLVFADDSTFALKALYARVNFTQHCTIPVELGCELTEQGYLKVDAMQKTTVKDVFACGDNSSQMRFLSNAAATGTFAGAVVNKEMVEETF